MKLLGIGSAVALAMTAMAPQAQAASITYSGTKTIGAGSYTLDLTTDGTLGAFDSSAIQAIKLTTTFGGVTTTAVSGDDGVYFQFANNPFTATATSLTFDFSKANALFNFGSSITGASICAGGSDYGCGANTAPGLGFTNGSVSESASISAPIAFASVAGAVPEMATWSLMVLGFGTIAGVMRGQRKRLVAA